MRHTEHCSVEGCHRLVSRDGKCRPHYATATRQPAVKMERRKRRPRLADRADLTADMVRELFHYDPETGIFRRRDTGRVTGTKSSSGYLLITLSGFKFSAHRLAWLYVHGQWPQIEIDHINRIRDDNRLVNLRDVTRSVNMMNRALPFGSATRGLTPGWRGGSVRKRSDRKKWEARYAVRGKYHHVGSFETREMAEAALIAALSTARAAA